MERDNFLDTNIIINYINFDEEFHSKITKKCRDYIIKNNAEKIILCFFVISELYNIMKKRANINHAVLQIIETGNENLYEDLPKRDIPYAKKLYLQFKGKNLEELEELFLKERIIFERKIEQFLKFKADIKVIQINQIKTELVSKIHNLISNHADCKVLASALQYQKTEKEKFNFVTADKDFAPNEYEFLEEQFEINYPKENWKFPNLVNLLYN